MPSIFVSVARISVALLVSALPSAGIVLATEFSLQAHLWTIAAALVVFSFSEIFFRNLLGELNTFFRRGGFSVRQLEELQQRVPSIRKTVWRCWNTSLILKGGVTVCLGALHSPKVSVPVQAGILFFCYGALGYGLLLSFWGQRNFRKLERWCDLLVAKETEIKEKKRLRSELDTGKVNDFEADKAMKAYSKRTHLAL